MDRHDAEIDPAAANQADPAESSITPSAGRAGDEQPSPPIRYGPSGRRLYTWDELPPRVKLRALHEGKWVAWSADGESVAASAEQLADLDVAVKQMGHDRLCYEWIELPRLRGGR